MFSFLHGLICCGEPDRADEVKLKERMRPQSRQGQRKREEKKHKVEAVKAQQEAAFTPRNQ
jgi:hypothetical protein